MNFAEAIFFNVIMTFGQSYLTDVEPMVNYSPEPEYIQELYCLATNTYHETRGEGFDGKIAVAQSVMARVKDENGEFRNYTSPCQVIKRSYRDQNGNPIKNRCWYSWYCDGKPDVIAIYHEDGSINKLEKEAWKKSVIAAFYAYHDLYEPLVDNATHYYNYKTANPQWSEDYQVVVEIGDHRFLKQ